MDDDLTAQVLLSLGRLEEGVSRLRLDFNEEKAHTHEHRAAMYQKFDKLEETTTIVGHTAAQAREESKATRKLLDEDIMPATEDFRRVQSFGKLTLWGVGAAATALGITAATVGSQVLSWLRSLIGPSS